MPKSKRKKPTHRGVNFIIGALRQLAKDGSAHVTGRIRLEAIDRLAEIENIYSVEIKPPSDSAPPKSEAASIIDGMLERYQKQIGGEHGRTEPEPPKSSDEHSDSSPN